MEPKIKVRFTASDSVKVFTDRGIVHQSGAVVEVSVQRAKQLCDTYPHMFTTDIDAHPGAAEGSASDEKEDGFEKSEPSLKKKSMTPRRNRAMKARNRK